MDTQEARIFTAIIISVILIVGIVIYFALSVIKQQKRNLKLRNSITLIELSTMEKERNRIAHDLHDELSPVLSAVKFHVEYVNVLNAEDKEQLRKASEYLDNMLNLIREISNNLMPATLLRKGLIAGLEEFVARVSDNGKMQILFSHEGEVKLPDEKIINIYRTAQELIHNAIKHSGAQHLEIKIEKVKGKLNILCKDDGRGFNYEEAMKNSTGLGLGSLRNRAALMEGTLRVESRIGVGSAFLIEIPLN